MLFQLRLPNTDEEQLRLLTVSHFIVAAATAPYWGLLLYSAMEDYAYRLPPQACGLGLFIQLVFSAGLFLLVCIYCGLLFGAGLCLRNRKNFAFVRRLSFVSWLNVPFGPLLAICTVRLLGRASVQQRFTNNQTLGSHIPAGVDTALKDSSDEEIWLKLDELFNEQQQHNFGTDNMPST